MARVSDAEVERLKSEVSVERLAEAMGVELKRHGKDLLGRCPFHEDKTPSLVISPAKNLWHCLGACRIGGTSIDWVMRAEGVSFRHAVELLRADVPSGHPGAHGRPVKTGTVRKLPAPVAPDADDAALLRQVVEYYHRTLKESPEALAYLEKRGLKSPELVDHFKLGFANRTLGLRLPAKNREAGAAMRTRLQKLGVLRESGHEHFNGSLVVPILGEGGEVLGMYGRKVTAGLRPGTPLHLYLAGPHRGVWNAAALKASKTVILCEALLDALTFWSAGFRNVITAYGVEGFTPAHLAALKEAGIEKVLIAYDRDDAGDGAAEELAPKLMAEGMECYRVEFPRGLDANAYGLQVRPAEKSLAVALNAARWMGKGQRPNPFPLVAQQRATTKTTPEIQAATAAVSKAEEISKPKSQAEQQPSAAAPRGAPQAPPQSAVVVPATVEISTALKTPAISVSARDTSEISTRPVISAPASPTPPSAPKVNAEVKEDEVVLQLGERRYRVRGLMKNTTPDALKVNLLCSQADRFHVDNLDLYSARQRAAYVSQAGTELGANPDAVKRELGQLLLQLEGLHEAQLKKATEPKEKTVTVGEADREQALELLRAPDLLERILRDFEKCGVVGEETNKLVGYLAAVSRKLEEPLAVLIQSSSAAGKSSLMDAVLALVPEEDRVKYSAMTGQSLFYMGDTNLKHKVLAIVEEEGASRASYALKLLQSEGELTIASTGKDPQTGRLVTHEYRVEGPCQLFLTTTAIELDEELLNRCLVLTVDEDRAQTRAIHKLQRERQTLEGLLARKDRDALLKLHRNAQRLLRPLLVANPFARELTFLDDKTRTRRDHMKYLTLIRTVALLHQYQRPMQRVRHEGVDVEYIEVTREDLAVANRLAHQVLGRSLDELPPQTRRLLVLLEELVATGATAERLTRREYRFTRRQVREAIGWGNTQLKVHLHRLEELEYVAVHRGPNGQGFAYELLYDGQGKDGTPFLTGLVDAAGLASGHPYDGARSGANGAQSGAGRPPAGPESGGGRPAEKVETAKDSASLRLVDAEHARNARLGSSAPRGASYENGAVLARPA